jgi:hypothetical protein
MPELALILILLFVLSHVGGMTGAHHCAQTLVRMGVLANVLPQLALNPDSPSLYLPNS